MSSNMMDDSYDPFARPRYQSDDNGGPGRAPYGTPQRNEFGRLPYTAYQSDDNGSRADRDATGRLIQHSAIGDAYQNYADRNAAPAGPASMASWGGHSSAAVNNVFTNLQNQFASGIGPLEIGMQQGEDYSGGYNVTSQGRSTSNPQWGWMQNVGSNQFQATVGKVQKEDGGYGVFDAKFNSDGSFADLSYRDVQSQDGWLDKLGDVVAQYGPAIMAAVITGGATGLIGGGAGAGFAGATASEASMIAAQTAAGGVGAGAGLGGAAAGAALSGAAPISASAPVWTAEGGWAAGAGAAGAAPISASTPVWTAEGGWAGAGAAGAAPISESIPAWVAPEQAATAAQGGSMLSKLGEYGGYAQQAISAASALGGLGGGGKAGNQVAQAQGQQATMQAAVEALKPPEAPPVPGANAPAEARGYQAETNPILNVLGRNRDQNRNRTMLTGAGGLNMDSVRVGGNTLLGM